MKEMTQSAAEYLEFLRQQPGFKKLLDKGFSDRRLCYCLDDETFFLYTDIIQVRYGNMRLIKDKFSKCSDFLYDRKACTVIFDLSPNYCHVHLASDLFSCYDPDDSKTDDLPTRFIEEGHGFWVSSASFDSKICLEDYIKLNAQERSVFKGFL